MDTRPPDGFTPCSPRRSAPRSWSVSVTRSRSSRPISRRRPAASSTSSAPSTWTTAVLVDPEQPGQSVLEEGSHVSAETSRRLACDASRVVMRHDEDGQVVEIGARTRTIPPALRRASTIGTGAVASRAARCGPGRPITCGTGPRAARRRCRTSRYCVGGITARCTRRATGSRGSPTARSNSDGRMAGRSPTCHHRLPCPRIRWRPSVHGTRPRGSSFTRARGSPSGWGSAWT